MVLDGERRAVDELDAFDCTVVGAGVADHGASERGVEFLARLTFEREPVVLRGDGDTAGLVFDDRDVDAPVAELHLVGAQPECAAEDLVAEADTEQRQALTEHLLGQVHRTVGGGRVAGTVGQEHTVGLQVQDVVQCRGGRQHMHSDAALREHARGVGLDTEVDRSDREACRAIGGFDHVSAAGAHFTGQVGAEHRRLAPDAVEEGIDVEVVALPREGVAGEHAGAHRAAGAQVPHERAGVDTCESDDVLPLEFVLQRSGGAPARGAAGRVANHESRHPDLRFGGLAGRADRFVVLLVPAGVADLRRGGHDDLTVVAGVGQSFLVAGHAGAEHGLTEGLPDGAELDASEDAPVLEDQHCGATAECSVAHALSPFCSTSPEPAAWAEFSRVVIVVIVIVVVIVTVL